MSRFKPAHRALVDGGSRLLPARACRAQLEGIGRADGGSGEFSGIDATSAQIVQC